MSCSRQGAACNGIATKWINEKSRPPKKKVDPYELITAQAAEAPAGCEGLYFLPYLTGERTPHADPHARGGWIGLTRRHGRAHLIRSIMEGATYALRDSLEIIKGMNIPIHEIRLSVAVPAVHSGDRCRPIFLDEKSSQLMPKKAPHTGRLYWLLPEPALQKRRRSLLSHHSSREQHSNDRSAKRIYNKAYPIYGRLYQSLREDFRSIAELID